MSSLKGSEIIALTGASSPFDDLCEREGIPIDQRDDVYTRLVQSGVYPGELKYTSKEGTRRVIENTIKRMHNKILEYKLKP